MAVVSFSTESRIWINHNRWKCRGFEHEMFIKAMDNQMGWCLIIFISTSSKFTLSKLTTICYYKKRGLQGCSVWTERTSWIQYVERRIDIFQMLTVAGQSKNTARWNWKQTQGNTEGGNQKPKEKISHYTSPNLGQQGNSYCKSFCLHLTNQNVLQLFFTVLYFFNTLH